MAETLRELVVSLSLNSSNFDQNIKSVNQRIKEAESNFQLAAAGTNGFDNSMRGAATRVSALKQRLDLQNQAVTQFEQKLAKASAALEKSRASTEKQSTALANNKRSHALLTDEIQKTEAAYKESVAATGDNSDASNELGVKLLDLKAKEKALSDEVKNGEAKLDAATKTVQRNDDAVSKAQTGLNNAKAAVKATRNELNQLTSGLGTAGAALGVLAAKAVTAGQSMSRAGRTLAMRVTAPLVALGAYAIKSAMDFESAFAGVRKTVNATEEEFARLEQSIKDMSLEVPSSTTAIAGVMEIAGQLGIATENLESFSRTIIDLANTTNLSAEEAATALAQFANVTGMSQGDANKFGSALVDLGNNFATTERDIMNMATRLAAAGSQVGLSESQILGFATALASVGLEAEAGGTAFSKVMTKMEVAVATNSKGLADFAKVSGMSKKEFVAAWKAEPAKAIESFIVGLSKMDEEGISAIATLEDMGLKEVRLRDTLLRATNATELFAKAQATAASAWGEGSALATEANVRYETMASQLEILKNRVSLAAQSLGTELAPMAKRVMEAISGLIDRFMALDTNQKEQIIKWAAIAAAVGPALIVLGKITSGAGKTVQAVLAITRALKGLSMVQMGWIGLAVAAVAGLVALMASARDEIHTTADAIDNLLENAVDKERVERMSSEIAIETTVTVDDYKSKIDAKLQEIKEYLTATEPSLTETEQADILSAIANKTGIDLLADALTKSLPDIDVQPVIDAITGAQSAINAAIEALGLSKEAEQVIRDLVAGGASKDEVAAAIASFGVDDGTAQMTADIIFNQMAIVDNAVADLGLSPEAQKHVQTMARSGATKNEIINALKAYGIPEGTAKEVAKTITGEMNVIDGVLEKLDISDEATAHIGMLVSQNASAEEIADALRSYGVKSDAADEAARKIVESMGRIDTTVEGLGLSGDTIKAMRTSVVGDKEALRAALKLLGLTDEDIDPILKSYDLLAGSLPAKLTAALNSVYQQLTDGLADTPAVMKRIKEEFDKAFQESIDTINAAAEAKIAELDPTAGDYQAKVDEIRRIQQEHTDAVTGYQKDAWGIIAGLANASKGEVDAAWVHIEEMLTQAGLLVAQYDDLEASLNQAQKNAVATVRAGATRDEKTIDTALSYTFQQYKLSAQALDDAFAAALAEAQARLTAGEINSGDYTAIEEGLRTQLTIDQDGLLSEYKTKLNELFVGVAEAFPEAAAAVKDAIAAQEDVDIMRSIWDTAIAKGEGKLQASDLSEDMVRVINDALGESFTPETLAAHFNEYGWQEGVFIPNILTEAASKINNAAADTITPETFGALGETYASAVEAGLFAPFAGDYGNSQIEAFKSIFGVIGASIPDGLTQGISENASKATDEVGDLADETVDTARGKFGTYSPSREFAKIGVSLVDGLILGVQNSTWKLRLAMAAMAREAIKAAKIALGIASPSKLFRDEIGRMMVRGVSLGVELETDQQRRAIANAARLMTASAREGVRGEANRITNDSRNQSVNVNIDNVNANSKQDIETLAQRLSALNLRQSRGYGY